VGRLAVVKAARNFDAKKGDLVSHAYRRIRNDMGREYGKHRRRSFYGLFAGEDVAMPESGANELLDALQAEEIALLYEIYGIGGRAKPMAEIGRENGVSREYVRQCKEKLLDKLRMDS
jgi:DNA-directed RNA polymerase sigma subunit (sigma70/sigma32)